MAKERRKGQANKGRHQVAVFLSPNAYNLLLIISQKIPESTLILCREPLLRDFVSRNIHRPSTAEYL